MEIVNLPQHFEKGPLAARLLQAANQDAEASSHKNSNRTSKEAREQMVVRSKLYQLTIEAWLGTAETRKERDQAWDEAERLLWELLNDATVHTDIDTAIDTRQTNQQHDSKLFTHSALHNVPNINGAFAKVVFHFCKDDGKQQLSHQTFTRLKPLVDKIQQLWKNKNVKLLASSSAVDAILYYYFKSQQAGEAHRLLQSIIASPPNKNRFLKQPSLNGINTVISAHAKAGNVEKAQELIDQMLAAASGASLPRPNVVSFNGILDAIHHRGGREAGVQAEEVLRWMESLSIHPNTVSFTTVISAWAKTGHPDAAERAEAILQHCIDLHVSGSRSDVAPSAHTFASVITAWSRSGRPDAAERAVGVIDMMKNLYEKGGLPSQNLTDAFNSLIITLGRSKSLHMWDKVTELLQYMEEAGITVNATTRSSVMIGLLKIQGDGPKRALDYFLDLEAKYLGGDPKAQLDVYCYNVALDALSKCDRNGAPAQALDILQRMIDNKNLQPTTPTFNTVMKILARSSLQNAALRCEHLLEELEGPGNLKPSGISYSTCISAWGYTRAPERFDRMRQLLSRMETSYAAGNQDAAPNIVPFNTLLIGCCTPLGLERERALNCILEALSDLRRLPGVTPNHNTYPLIFRSIGLTAKPGESRDSLLFNEFEHCVKDGLVCSSVVDLIQQLAPKLFQARLPIIPVFSDSNSAGVMPMGQIPREWKRNVPAAHT